MAKILKRLIDQLLERMFNNWSSHILLIKVNKLQSLGQNGVVFNEFNIHILYHPANLLFEIKV